MIRQCEVQGDFASAHICRGDLTFVGSARQQSRFIDQVGQVSPSEASGTAGNALHCHILPQGQALLLYVPLQDLLSPCIHTKATVISWVPIGAGDLLVVMRLTKAVHPPQIGEQERSSKMRVALELKKRVYVPLRSLLQLCTHLCKPPMASILHKKQKQDLRRHNSSCSQKGTAAVATARAAAGGGATIYSQCNRNSSNGTRPARVSGAEAA